MTTVESIPSASPSDQPIALAEAKSHLRITHTDEDAYLQDILIPGVTAKIEERYGVALREQTFLQTMDSIEAGVPLPNIWHPPRSVTSYGRSRIKLLRRPVTNIDSITTTAEDGTETVFTDYYLAGDHIVLTAALPAHRSTKGIAVQFDAGYTDLPASVKSDLLKVIDDVYSHRGTYISGSIVARLPDGVFGALNEVMV